VQGYSNDSDYRNTFSVFIYLIIPIVPECPVSPWEERGKIRKEGLAPLLNCPLSGDGVSTQG